MCRMSISHPLAEEQGGSPEQDPGISCSKLQRHPYTSVIVAIVAHWSLLPEVLCTDIVIKSAENLPATNIKCIPRSSLPQYRAAYLADYV